MEEPKDSLVIQYGVFKASASGRFAIIAVLVCLTGAGVFMGMKAIDLMLGSHPVAIGAE